MTAAENYTPSVKYTVDGGTATSVTVNNTTYTVSGISATKSLKFQNVNTTNTQLRIKTIQITYTKAGGSEANGLAWSASEATAIYGAENTFPTLTNTHGLTVTYASSNTDVATIDQSGAITLNNVNGTTTISATFAGDNTYANGTVSYTLTVKKAAAAAPKDGDTETITFSKQGYDNQEAVSEVKGENFTVTFDKGTNTNAPKYFTSGTAIRAYGGNTITIASDYDFRKVEITFGDSDGSNAITASTGTYESGTWTGGAKELTLTIGGTTGNRRIASIKITYGAEVKVPSLTVDPSTAETFTYELGAGPSETQEFILEGKNLTAGVAVSVTGEFEITDDETYGSSLTLTGDDIFSVRLKSGLSIGTYTGKLTISTTGVDNIEIDLNGEVTAVAEPAIEVAQTTITATAAETEGTIAVTYTKVDAELAELQYCNSEGTKVAENTYAWLTAILKDDGSISYSIDANTGEERTAYLKVYGLDNDANDVYSALITITQAEYVAPVDYATLPFEYTGNGTGTLPEGLTVSGLGTYSSDPKIKFDGAGDYLMLKFNEAPGVITFTIKGQPSSGTSITGTFKVQVSADGTSFSDLAEYVNLSSTTATYNLRNNDASVRYVKWIYTAKSSGNVALGNISVAKYVAPVDVTITAAGLATFASDDALDFTNVEGVKAYKASVSGTTVSLTAVTTVPAGAGILVRAMDAEGEAVTAKVPVAAETVAEWTDNAFVRGTGVAVESEANGKYNYILNIVGGTLGFYAANKQTVDTNRAYLQTSSNQARLTLNFGDETTAIVGIERQQGRSEVYDLQGRRVSQPQKGLYIMDGRKVVVK